VNNSERGAPKALVRWSEESKELQSGLRRYFRSLSEGRMSIAYDSTGAICNEKVRTFYEESASIKVRRHNVTR
jgi:hypothetical protein